MTKDETLDLIIQKYKDGAEQGVKMAYCDEIKWNCFECPFWREDSCQNAITESLIERLIDVEERQKTNLQHYIDVTYMEEDDNICVFRAFLKPSVAGDFNKSGSNDFYKWLLSPHKEPKYKLTQIEIDFIHACASLNGVQSTLDSYVFNELQSKGYFKGIPKSVPINKIINNCEVIDS